MMVKDGDKVVLVGLSRNGEDVHGKVGHVECRQGDVLFVRTLEGPGYHVEEKQVRLAYSPSRTGEVT